MQRVNRLVIACVAFTIVGAIAAPTAFGQTPPPPIDPYRATIATAIDDLNAYWEDKFDDLYPLEEWQPLPSDLVIAGAPGVALPDCGGPLTYELDLAGNAFFCPASNYMAYDDVGLMPELFTRFRRFSVALLLAHEFGHVVQDRAGDAAGEPTILQELQADCFAGAYTRSVQRGKSSLSPLEGGERDLALAAFLELRDRIGTAADDPNAHGSGFDRTGAFQDGVIHGPGPCVDYFDDPPLIVEVPFQSEADALSGGTLPADKVIAVGTDLLNDFYSSVGGDIEYRPIDWDDDFRFFRGSDPATLLACGGVLPTVEQVRSQVYWCVDGYIAWDHPFVSDTLFKGIGDMAVIGAFSRAWASYVRSEIQHLQFAPGSGDVNQQLLGPDCYTGSFVGAMARGELESDELSGLPETLTLSPGDFDEIIQGFLVQIEALGGAEDFDITFPRLRAFRRGFLKGLTTCTRYDQPYERT